MPRGSRLALFVIVAVATAFRSCAFIQLSQRPALGLERWGQTDMHYYDTWARQIAGGDWLTARVPLPMHRWHHEIASAYLTSHPAAAVHGRPDPEEAMWARWMRAPVFYQDPLYSYAAAAVYAVVSPDPRLVIAAQLMLGVLTTLLVYALGRRHFGEAAGLCGAALAAACAPLMFYELLLLRDSAVAFAGLALAWLVDRSRQRRAVGASIALGIGMGLACLLKSTFYLFSIGVLVVQVATRRVVGWRAVAATLIAFLVTLSPAVIRNRFVGAPMLSMAASGPMTFVASNEAQAIADVGFGIDAPVLTRFLAETDGGWLAAVRTSLAQQTVLQFTGRLWRKWDRAWHWFEIPNNENLYYVREQITALRWMPVSFWILAPLALTGLLLGVRRAPHAWPLYLLVASTLASLIGFYVLGRFRVSLIAATLPFAGLTLAQGLAWVRGGQWSRALATAGAVAVLAVWTGRPLSQYQLLIRTADWILPYSTFYQDRVSAAVDRKDWNAAANEYLAFFGYEPPAAVILGSEDRRLAPELADMHAECAQILHLATRDTEAALQMQRAKDILALRPLR